VTAQWEPAPGVQIADDELEALFNTCSVEPTTPLTVSVTGA
jgi:hypothetical protein